MLALCHGDHQGMICEWSNHILTISSTCCLKTPHKLDSQSSLSSTFCCEVFSPILASQLAGSFYTENRSLQLVKKKERFQQKGKSPQRQNSPGKRWITFLKIFFFKYVSYGKKELLVLKIYESLNKHSIHRVNTHNIVVL